MIVIKRAYLVCGLLLLSSCSYLPKKDGKGKQLYTPSAYELEARLNDCTFPLGFKVLVNQSNEQNHSIKGTTSLRVEELVEFYTHDMERMGWELRAVFKLEATNLVFIKPHTTKTCLITFTSQPFKRVSVVEIFITK